jgi:hypothetical protein
MKNNINISDRGKRRLQLAANFLRARKYKFEGNNFYDIVINVIYELEENERNKLKDLVDWIETYEMTELSLKGRENAPAFKQCNTKNVLTKNSSSSPRFPSL